MIHEEKIAELAQADAAVPPNIPSNAALYSCRVVFCLRRERIFRANARPAPPHVE